MATRRFSLTLDDAQRARLRARAKAHGVNMSKYLRALIDGHRPGAEPGSDAAAADRWYDSRSPARRVAVARYHAPHLFKADEKTTEAPLSLFEEGTP